MVAKRIIPCLDVKEGRVVKGIHFENLRDAGDPVENAAFYSTEGADELVFLDISATIEGRNTMRSTVRDVASRVSIPFTVGGGIRTVADIQALLQAGADKVSINTQAVKTPSIIREGAQAFGSQCIVVAIDAKEAGPGRWRVHVESGRTPTDLDAVEWAQRAEDLGAGEILLTSIDADGTQKGYDVKLTRCITGQVGIPVIASGGAGELSHLREVLSEGRASAVLMASLLHFRVYAISQIKEFLAENGIAVRM